MFLQAVLLIGAVWRLRVTRWVNPPPLPSGMIGNTVSKDACNVF